VLVHRFADPVYGVEYSLKKLASRKVGLALLHKVVPEVVADSLVQRAVAKDREAPRPGCDQNQCCILRLVLMESGALELVLGAFERIDRLIWNDPDRNPAGRTIFGVTNRCSDRITLLAVHGEKFTTGA
jgi:hypothetical protein